jgi:hypothetical protein
MKEGNVDERNIVGQEPQILTTCLGWLKGQVRNS